MNLKWDEMTEGQEFFTTKCVKPNIFIFTYGKHVAFMTNRGKRVICHKSELNPLKEPDV